MTRLPLTLRSLVQPIGPLLLLGGCWISHSPSLSEPTPPADAAPEAAADARPDTADASTDAPAEDAPPPPLEDAAPPPPSPPPLPERCRITPFVRPFDDPVLEFRWPAGPVAHTDAIHVCSTPMVADLDRTDESERPRIVFLSYSATSFDGILRIVDPADGSTISQPDDETAIGFLAPTGHVALADLDGDGRLDIVAAGVSSGLHAFRADGTPWWSSPYPLARERGGIRRFEQSVGPAPTVADLDGDGAPEVVLGRTVVDGLSGAHRWTGEGETGRGINNFLGPISCIADLDGDGIQEVIAGSTAFRADGRIFWNRYAELGDGLCAVADLLSESAGPEVVFVGNGHLRLLAAEDGRALWQIPLQGRLRIGIGGAPTVADFDGDDRPEIGVAHGTAYAVYDPSCTAAGVDGCLAAGLLWQRSTADASSSGTGSSVFDFNGDGRAEVVYNDEQFFRIYDGTSGRVLFRSPNSSRTRTENPVIADVDEDGDAEIVFGANAEAFFIRRWWTDPGLEVWGDARGRWVGARPLWNQHAYHITNIEANGTIPRSEPTSWEAFNSYRQNLREDGDVLAAPDLWGGRGRVRCASEGGATLVVNVANWGLERAGAGVTVAFFEGRPSSGGRRIGEARTSRSLAPRGDSEQVTFRLERPREGTIYWALLDAPEDRPEGRVAECLEENNEVWIGPVRCP